MTIAAIWALLSGWLVRIDWRVWAAAGAVGLLLYYGHWSKDLGRAEVQSRVNAEVAASVQKIKQADIDTLVAAEDRANEARIAAAVREEKIDGINVQAAQSPDSGALCVPADLADRLRGL